MPPMPVQNFPDNILYELDNLDVLRGMNSETIDLIATDPPFNTGRNRSGTAGFYVDNWKWGDTGILPDQWAWNEVHPVWLEQVKDDNPALYDVITAARSAHGDGIAAFLCFLSVRLMECRRVLKATGQIYLHCDHSANAYIRMAMDAIFGSENFQNEIVWQRTVTRKGNLKRRLARDADVILRYSKSDDFVWNVDAVTLPYDLGNLDEKTAGKYSRRDKDGRLYQLVSVEAPKQNPDSTSHYELMGVTRTWRWTKERMQEAVASGRVVQSRPGAVPRQVLYLDEQEGKTLNNVWVDIPAINSQAHERTGSPDQKPLALYERIILASSKPGDLVLDPFAGCATTIIAARKHGRRWVGVDRRTDARYHVVCRLAGIKAKDAEATIKKRPDLANWLNEQLAKYDAHYSTDAPERTDEGETAAPGLGPVYTTTRQPWQRLNHAEMRGILGQAQVGATGDLVVCAGCGRGMEVPFMELDHITPKNDKGENYITNRILICGPCNKGKKELSTLSGLHRENKRSGWMRDEPKAKAAIDAARRVSGRVRDAWASPDVQALVAAARGDG